MAAVENHWVFREVVKILDPRNFLRSVTIHLQKKIEKDMKVNYLLLLIKDAMRYIRNVT